MEHESEDKIQARLAARRRLLARDAPAADERQDDPRRLDAAAATPAPDSRAARALKDN